MSILATTAILLGCLAAVLLAMAAILLVEVAAAFLPARPLCQTAPRPYRFAVVVPAHNEALVIGATLASVAPQLSENDRLLVVADNCTDETGRIAEAAGSEVIYRTDTERRGKGFALDFAIRRLAADPPDVVVFVDADCIASPGSLRAIAGHCLSRQRPVQARYDLELPAADPSDGLQVASFAWTVKNHLRPLGLNRLGLPCQLMGTGMAFPWDVIVKANLDTADIVEDLALGLELAAAGKAPVFFPEALISSQFPVSREGQQTQRARWETGHLRMIWGRIPRLLLRGMLSGNRDLIVLAADASIPPLTLLCLSIGVLLPAACILAALGDSLLPLGISVAAAGALTLSVGLAARRLPRKVRSLNILGLIARYAASKFAIYAGAVTGKQIEWVRSKRD